MGPSVYGVVASRQPFLHSAGPLAYHEFPFGVWSKFAMNSMQPRLRESVLEGAGLAVSGSVESWGLHRFVAGSAPGLREGSVGAPDPVPGA